MTVERDAQEAREPEVGPAAEGPPEFHPYHHPAAGWGAAKSVTKVLMRERALSELAEWSDFALEDRGRLTEPMAREPDTNNATPTRPLDSLVLPMPGFCSPCGRPDTIYRPPTVCAPPS
ncbi:hypothetical protein HDA42_006191 [Streptomyces costaricanus]|uniref:Uncharacterized protein n=1 Tax=Streptomyces murinus TaxID=33900 RepID=A0A7W3RQ35_STRMR|nr:hypothetical protein [Streptomyces murinus]